METSYKISLSPQTIDSAPEEVQPILEATKKQLGFLPNMYGNLANSLGLLSTYKLGYDLFRKKSGFSRVQQEVIFLTISYENECRYCVAAHSFMADMMAKVPVEVTEAIRNGTIIQDPKLRALSEFTSIMVNKRGNPEVEDVEGFLAAGYTEAQILEIILAISIKTISNYTNHVFDTPVDLVMKSREWAGYSIARKIVRFFGGDRRG